MRFFAAADDDDNDNDVDDNCDGDRDNIHADESSEFGYYGRKKKERIQFKT